MSIIAAYDWTHIVSVASVIRDTAKWYGKGERLQHEVHHALVVEVYDVAERALAAVRSREQQEGTNG